MYRWAVIALAVGACHASKSASSDAAPAPGGSAAAARANAAATGHASALAHSVPAPPPPSGESYPFFHKATLSTEELTKLVTDAPELSRVGAEVSLFDPGDGNYISRSTADREGVIFTSQPLLWGAEPGQQVLVVAARGKAASFVAAWWVLQGGGYRLASTFVMLGEIAPIALAYKHGERQLWWTTCWQCPGETGHVSVREDHHIVIVQD